MADPLVDRFRNAFKALLGEYIPNLKFLAPHRYAVTACDYDAQTFDGEPSISKYGLPRISKVPIRSALKVELKPGQTVLVGFESGDPGYPYIANPGQLALFGKAQLRADDEIKIGEGASLPAARQGDMCLVPAQGVVVMFASLATGDPVPAPLSTMTPYFVSWTTITSVPPVPSFPAIGNVPGIVSSGSPFVKTS